MIRFAIKAAIAAVLSSVIKRPQPVETLSLDFTTQTYRVEV